jgi:hypothetical protein
MRWKTTAVLAVLLVALGTFYYVYEIREGPAREKAAVEKDRIWKDLEAKDIDDVVLKREADTIHLTKSGDAWTLVAPVEGRAERQPVEDLLSALATARTEREIDPNPAKPGDFGLAPPAVEVTFRAQGQERRLRLGAKNPTGIWVYAQQASQPAVFLVPESLLLSAQKSASDFRDHTVLAFEPTAVRGLEVRGPTGQTITAATRQGTDDWQVTAPLAAPADRQAISGLLDKLRAAKIKAFVSAAPDAKSADPYGLEHPLRLTLSLGEEKDRVAQTLRFGKAVPDQKAVYAEREGDPTIFLVDQALLNAVPASPTALRDKTVLAYHRTKLERVELESPKGRVALALDKGAWRITAPAPLPADEDAMNQLLSRLQDLRATAFVADDAKRLGSFGLDHPQVRLSVWEQDAKEPKTLLLAPARGREGAYATVTGGGAPAPVVLVDAKALADLSRSAQDLRDHSLLPSFEVREVTGIRIDGGGSALVLARSGEDEWRLTSPRAGKAQSSRVTDLIWSLRGLKWHELVAEQGWDAGRYGLAPPARTITLSGKDGKTLATLALGRRDPTRLYAQVPGQPALYALDPQVLGSLPAKPDDLL